MDERTEALDSCLSGNSMLSANSYMGQTGQSWKFWVFLITLFSSGVLLLGPLQMQDRLGASSFTVAVLTGAFLFILDMIWLSVAIRCRKCKASLGWRAISKGSHETWLLGLLTMESCPVCKDNATDRTG